MEKRLGKKKGGNGKFESLSGPPRKKGKFPGATVSLGGKKKKKGTPGAC